MAATYFLIRGIEPPDLRVYPQSVRARYWGWVAELGLKAKDSELARGLDADGKPLTPVSAKTRKYRRSAMTPTGKGDPSAPALMPGRGLSRTRSLLAARARDNYAEFYWRYDPWTGDQWGKILAIHARRGRNVVGISPQSVRKVQAAALKLWTDWKQRDAATNVVRPRRQIASMSPEPVTAANRAAPSPWRTVDQWEQFARQSVPRGRLREPAMTAPSVRRGALNQLLAWIWGR